MRVRSIATLCLFGAAAVVALKYPLVGIPTLASGSWTVMGGVSIAAINPPRKILLIDFDNDIISVTGKRESWQPPTLPLSPKTHLFTKSSIRNTSFMTSAPGVLSFSGLVRYDPGVVEAVEFSFKALFFKRLPLQSGVAGNQVSFAPLPASELCRRATKNEPEK